MNRLIFSCIGLIALCNISLAQGVDVAISKQQANISLNRAQGFMGSLNLKIENIKLEKDFLFDRLNSFKTETDDAVCYVNPEKNCISVFVKKKLESSKDIDKIKQSSAMQLSQKYLTAAGIDLNELELLRCELNNDSGRMRWEICYLRSYNKFTFLQDHAFVSINPSTGELEALGCDLNSPLPESVAVSVRIESAERNARDYMNAIIGPLGKLTNSKLAIINPDNNWESYGTGNTSLQDKSRTRLAWILEYDAPWDNTTVFVDAVDGNVIGGFRSRSSPKSAIKDQVLLTSKLVTISYNNHKKSCLRTKSAFLQFTLLKSFRMNFLREVSCRHLIRLFLTAQALQPISSASARRALIRFPKWRCPRWSDRRIWPQCAWYRLPLSHRRRQCSRQ
jgi:hypothetical protein